jgi:hypothetical protein
MDGWWRGSEEVREEVMRRIDGTGARAVVVDGLGAASEVEAVRGRWKLEPRNGRRVPALPLACGIAYGGGAQDNGRMNSEACEGMRRGIASAAAVPAPVGCAIERRWELGAVFLMSHGTLVGRHACASPRNNERGGERGVRAACGGGSPVASPCMRCRAVCGDCVLATVCDLHRRRQRE